MARQLENWIKSWMEFTYETEAPDQYHFWSAVTVLAAATKRQVYVNWRGKRFPNHYCIIVGPPGARKSSAVDAAASIAGAAGLRRFSDKITGAALLKDLSEASEKYVLGSTVEITSSILIYSSELGVFMGPDAFGSGVISDLTDLYDCGGSEGRWEKKTLSRGSEVILGPFVNMLAASTPQTLKDVLPAPSVGQGFTSRIIFVWGDGRRKRVPIPDWSDKLQRLKEALVHDLREVSKLKGEFTFSPEARDLYIKNYLERPDAAEEYADDRFSGYASRKDAHIVKLAMVMSLAARDSLVISLDDMAMAIEAIRWLDEGLKSVFAGHGNSTTSEDVNRISKQISLDTKRFGYCSHQGLVRRNTHSLSADEFNRVIRTLIEGGVINETVMRDPKTGQIQKFYKSTDVK